MNGAFVIAARPRGGFSLLEITISFSLLGVFIGSLLVVLFTGTRAAGSVIACQGLDGSARQVLDRIATELASAGASALVPDPTAPFGSTSLTFQGVDGIDADSAVVWSTPVRLGLELEDGEIDDSIDNDGDGLIDEHELVWTSDLSGPRERRVVWVHGVREYLQGEEGNGRDDNDNGLVDERGLSFARQGGRLTIRLTLIGRSGAGDEIARSAQTTLRLRN